jgi:hypothetical protein
MSLVFGRRDLLGLVKAMASWCFAGRPQEPFWRRSLRIMSIRACGG